MFYSFIVSFILGIVFESFWGGGWTFGLLVFILSLVISLLFFQEQPLNCLRSKGLPLTILIIGFAFFLGVLRMNIVNTSPDPNLSKFVNQNISFEAVISKEPDVRDISARYIVRPYFSPECVSDSTDIFLLENSSCFLRRAPQGNQKHILSKSRILLIANRFPEFKYGDKIKVSGQLNLPKNFKNKNGAEFNYVSYLSKDNIHFIIYKPKIEKIGSGAGNKIISSLYSLKNVFIENISRVVPEPNSSLLGGLIFGAKQSLGQTLLNDFREVGLIHIVVLSGYNITIIAAGIFFVTSFFGKRKLGFIISAISIALFAVMVGLGATVIRASIMALIAILARFLGRPADALRWLFIAGFLMILWNPLILFYDPSFQLSFMAALGLILFSPFIFSFISKHKFQKFIPEKFGLREIISATLAVQFFVLPLLIRMSGFVSIVSFIINPLILPLVPFAMALGALTGALGIISQIVSWPFGILSYFITQIIISTTEFGASLPFATFQIGALPLWIIFLWYVGYFFLFKKLNTSLLSDKSVEHSVLNI